MEIPEKINQENRVAVKNQKEVANMFFYTFIMTYSGGVYIHQVNAKNESDAMRQWLKELEIKEIKGFEEHHRQRLISEDFLDETPILIKGCKNVWCFGLKISVRKPLALINIVKTSKK